MLKQIDQECSMRVKKVSDSPIFGDKTENRSLFMKKKKCCKQEYSKETLSWYNFNPKGIIIFPYDEQHSNCPDFAGTVPVFSMLSRCHEFNQSVPVFRLLTKKKFIFT